MLVITAILETREEEGELLWKWGQSQFEISLGTKLMRPPSQSISQE
jgi:hypothetical protein